jgi:hypothetical protein
MIKLKIGKAYTAGNLWVKTVYLEEYYDLFSYFFYKNEEFDPLFHIEKLHFFIFASNSSLYDR